MYYTTGKGTYRRGEVGVAVEIDDATAKVLIEKGYLTEKKDAKVEVVAVKSHTEILEPKTQGIVEIIHVEQPKVKRRGNPAWGKKK